MHEIPVMSCEACGKEMTIARSVRLRSNPEPEFEQIVDRFPDPNDMPDSRREELDRVYLQYLRNAEYRRAFICPACYRAIDTHVGAGIVVVEGAEKRFHISGDSRRDRAAVYDYDKWLRYQQREAAKLGIDLSR